MHIGSPLFVNKDAILNVDNKTAIVHSAQSPHENGAVYGVMRKEVAGAHLGCIQ